VENPRWECRSRERATAPTAVETLGRRRLCSACEQDEEAREGRDDPQKGKSAAVSKRPKRGPSPRRQSRPTLAKPQRMIVSSSGREDPEGASNAAANDEHQEGTALERAYGGLRGEKPRRVNPMDGTGMEHARQVMGGAKRREGAKP